MARVRRSRPSSRWLRLSSRACGRGAAIALAATVLLASRAVFATWPHRALDEAWTALHDAPAVRAPFDPVAYPGLHGLVALAAFGLALAAVLAVTRRAGPALLAAAVAVGVGFPAVLLEDTHALALGALALGAVLWASVVQRAGRHRPRAARGVVLAAVS